MLISVKMLIKPPFLLSFAHRFRQEDFRLYKQRSKLLMRSVSLAVITVSDAPAQYCADCCCTQTTRFCNERDIHVVVCSAN